MVFYFCFSTTQFIFWTKKQFWNNFNGNQNLFDKIRKWYYKKWDAMACHTGQELGKNASMCTVLHSWHLRSHGWASIYENEWKTGVLIYKVNTVPLEYKEKWWGQAYLVGTICPLLRLGSNWFSGKQSLYVPAALKTSELTFSQTTFNRECNRNPI